MIPDADRPVTSAKDPRLEQWVERSRGDGDLVVVDGPKLVREALAAKLPAELLLLGELSDEDAGAIARAAAGIATLRIEGRLERKLTDTASPRGAVLLAKKPDAAPLPPATSGAFLAVLDGIQDPGNAGGIVRAAYAFGAAAVVFAAGTARPFSPKVVRASAGTILRIPACTATAEDLDAAGWRTLLLDGDSAVAIDAPLPDGGVAVVVGSEGQGLSGAFRGEARSIPTVRPIESLAALSAASIAFHSVARPRKR